MIAATETAAATTTAASERTVSLATRRAICDEIAGMLEREAEVQEASGNRIAAAETRRNAAKIRAAGRWPIALPAEPTPTTLERRLWIAALTAGAVRGLDTAELLAAIEHRELLADAESVAILEALDRARIEISEVIQGVRRG